MTDPLEPALAVRFAIEVDGHTISRFTACDGLAGEWEVEEYREGGNPDQVIRLPLRLNYKNVRLTRPVDSESGKLAEWFSKARTEFQRVDASVVAYTANGGDHKEVARWDLVGVWPIKYTGPTFSSAGTTAATEILELAHNGFTLKAG
jgi:phage tail-like protein